MSEPFSKKFYSRTYRARFISLYSGCFAIIYHFIYLFVFKFLNVNPMFYFNIASVFIFAAMIIATVKVNSPLIPYTISGVEVLVHQIFAEYYLGAATSFRFLILIIGFLPLLVFSDKLRFAVTFGIFSMIIFCLLEIRAPYSVPVYTISENAVNIIRITNIAISILILFSIVALFTLLMNKFEGHLEDKVSNQTKQILQQSEKIIKIQNDTIISLSNLVENRDTDTGEHVQRTSAYVNLLAKEAQKEGYYTDILTDDYIDLLTRAAPMHDIGKIVISDAILKKPGRLTAEEFEEIKRHTTEGRRIVYSVLANNDDKKYVETAAEMASFHHEKWNGNGYPFKKSGEDIPLSARIMAVADVFDALVSQRCYKKPVPVDEAYNIILESSGEHFDPILVNCFVNIRREVEKIAESERKTAVPDSAENQD